MVSARRASPEVMSGRYPRNNGTRDHHQVVSSIELLSVCFHSTLSFPLVKARDAHFFALQQDIEAKQADGTYQLLGSGDFSLQPLGMRGKSDGTYRSEPHNMNALDADAIRGNWATLLLAWNEDESLDLHRVGEAIDRMISFGVDGIYSCGTAGEFHTLTEPEFDAVSTLLATRCEQAHVPFQIGVSHMSAQLSRERLKRVVALAPSAVQVILPDWYPVTLEEAIAFLHGMAESAPGIGLVLYNPPHAKRVLSPEEIGVLSRSVPSLVGVKTAGGDEVWYEAMRKHIEHLIVFVPGHRLATGVGEGASGAYSNAACLHPGAAQAWYRQMQTDLDGALEVESRLCEFIVGHIVPFITEGGYCPGACDRLLAGIGGWADVGYRMRWPYRAIPEHEVERLRPIAQSLIPEFVTPSP